METTIKKELTQIQMEKIFNRIYVKNYEPSYLYDKNRKLKSDEKISFDITVRHNPAYNAENIFNTAFNEL